MTRRSADILTDAPPASADLRIAYGTEPLQFGDLRLPATDGPHPLAVVIHGGYWQSTYNLIHAGHMCIDLALHGVATWNVEYRRLGDPDGGWPGTFDDVARAVGHIAALPARYPVDLGRVVFVGHSAGGQLALWAAAKGFGTCHGVVSLAGVVDLHATAERGDDRGLIERLLGGAPEEVPDRWAASSPRRMLPLRVRQLLVCGTDDPHLGSNTPYAEAAAAAGDMVELLVLEGAGHFELIDPSANEWPVIRAGICALAGLDD